MVWGQLSALASPGPWEAPCSTRYGSRLGTGTRNNRVINNYLGLDRLGRYLRNTGRAVVNRGRDNTIRGNRHRPRNNGVLGAGAGQAMVVMTFGGLVGDG